MYQKLHKNKRTDLMPIFFYLAILQGEKIWFWNFHKKKNFACDFLQEKKFRFLLLYRKNFFVFTS